MFINVHLDKKEITEALKNYLEKKGYFTEKEPLITMEVSKGDARESEIWDATISGCIPKPS